MRFCKVINPNLAGISSTSGASTGDDGNLVFSASCKEMAFLMNGVDGIDHGVRPVLEKQCVGIFLRIKARMEADFDRGINFSKAVSEHRSL